MADTIERRRSARWGRVVAALLAPAFLAVLPADPAAAAKKLDFPVAGESPGVPAYARVGMDPAGKVALPHDDQWAAIVFYREVACVPSGFNLMAFFDAPAAFGCPMTVEGHEVWKDGFDPTSAPIHVVTRDAGPVPVWFVSWPALQAAAADGALTKAELAALPSLVTGTATSYHEVLHPDEMILINARGTLSDGRSFKIHAMCQCLKGHERTRITIG